MDFQYTLEVPMLLQIVVGIQCKSTNRDRPKGRSLFFKKIFSRIDHFA